MKRRLVSILLVLALACFTLSGCDRRSPAPEETDGSEGNFEPETTVAGGLTMAVEEQAYVEPIEVPQENISAEEPSGDAPEDSQDIVEDEPLNPDEEVTGEDGDTAPEITQNPDMPFATPTPQPNASVSQYSEISAPGLGFRFNYPSGWVNIPGRSTVCYVQPLEDGTVYPARVAVTMKRMPHASSYDEAQTELANYIRTLMAQYDESTFKVDTNLDYETRFMGRPAIATTYLAYDGPQEIKGYTIITYFERYLFVYHFLCAYEDYSSFEATMRYMRDSVQADASVAPQ